MTEPLCKENKLRAIEGGDTSHTLHSMDLL